MNKICCGGCSFFKYEDMDGYGWCDIRNKVHRCSDLCELQDMSVRDCIKTLHFYQKYRRGGNIKMPHPTLIGLAIDKAIHELRKLPKEDWACSIKSDTVTVKAENKNIQKGE